MSFRPISPLYAILDPSVCPDRDPLEVATEMIEGGTRLLQLRWKDAPAGLLCALAGRLRTITHARRTLLFINDRIDVALASGADGAHVGQHDLPATEARRLLGRGRLLGVSTHDPDQARSAERAGADYVGFGPLFPTSTKETGYTPRGLEALRRVREAVKIPIVAIGGICDENARTAIEAGADVVAMISSLASGGATRERVARVLDVLRSR